jgi:ABC-2 type transport system permease protein
MKSGAFRQIVQEEWEYLRRRNGSVLVLLLLLPVCYSILFGLVYRQNVIRQLPTAVYDQDQSSTSRKYIRLFEDSEKFNVTAYVDSQEEMERLLREESVLAAIAVPPDFAKHIKQGRGTETVLIVNSANNTLSNSAITFAWEINRSFSAATGQQLFEGLNRMPGEAMNLAYPVHVSVRLLHNPLSGFSPFMLAGLSVQGVQIALLLAAGPMLVREVEERRFAPVASSALLMLGKMVPYWLASLAASFIALLVQVQFFAMPMRGSWLEIFVLVNAFIFAVLCVLQLFSALSPNQLTAVQIPMIYIMPGTLYSGLSWPVFAMNRAAELYAAFMPVRYTAENVRDIMLAGYAPTLWADCRALLCGALAAFLAARFVFDRKRRRIA